MTRDRRRNNRADLGRRDAMRMSDYREVVWRDEESDASRHFAWLVDQSGKGFAMLTENSHTPAQGATIAVAVHAHHRDRFEPVVVTRTKRLSSVLDLVTAEYPAVAGATAGGV